MELLIAHVYDQYILSLFNLIDFHSYTRVTVRFFRGFSISQKNVDEAVNSLKAQGIEALGLVCHVSNEQQRKSHSTDGSDATDLKYRRIDVIESNAAANPSVDAILDTQE
ncbi:hypothetical protein LXL04_027910 [Taraxacum kok-saghyz]